MVAALIRKCILLNLGRAKAKVYYSLSTLIGSTVVDG